jgi:DNA polymerase-3 subunit gamma/tau
MSYQVLARKWRPRSFEDMVGQAHVVRALTNALDQDRLHHAYLFTGTRGVGKTTLARILSKALNCEQGVSARPCGQCSACREIDEGRFIDLLEVDAASRTKVDQTRDLLDNVPFAPVKGRFKVYLIDEVHMFSASSFNALLKTLEEPPPHVKFLLATTDPQKVPVTVLSRCLQFNLKRLVPEEIRRQLAHILETEGIAFEDQALARLARAADGSMRDGLSLLDQAIAFGGGQVMADEVRAMLGTVGRDLSLNLLAALAAREGAALLDEVARIHELTPDFAGVLQELLGLLHRIALYQQVPATLAEDDPEHERLRSLAGDLSAEDLQLYYQIALLGQRDLPLAPDPRTGLEMVLLRMLAFRPAASGGPVAAVAPRAEGAATRAREPATPGPAPVERGRSDASAPAAGSAHPAAAALAAARLVTGADRPTQRRSGDAQTRTAPKPAPPAAVARPVERRTHPEPVSEPSTPAVPAAAVSAPAAQGAPRLAGAEDWHALVARLGLGGVTSELAGNCEIGAWDGERLVLTLDPACEHLKVPTAEARLREALTAELGAGVRLELAIARPEGETPARRRAREVAERQARAEVAIENDPVVVTLRDELGARIIPGTIAPADIGAPGGDNP